VLARERPGIVEGVPQHRGVVHRADAAQHYRSVAFEPPQFRALHREALERGAELRPRDAQDLARQRPRVLAA
jgi:hypothetical protein